MYINIKDEEQSHHGHQTRYQQKKKHTLRSQTENRINTYRNTHTLALPHKNINQT